MTIDSVADCFRVANAVLAVLCAVMMVAARGADPALRPFTLAVVLLLFWNSYTSVELLFTSGPDTPGLRVYGFTVLLTGLLGVLVWEYRKRRHL